MEHLKTLQYQIRCTNNETGEKEVYPIDWGVHTTVVKDVVLINFTHANGTPSAFMVRPEYTIEIGFFEVEY